MRSRSTLTVMQLLPSLDGGGVERGTLEVAKALVDAGHRSLVVSKGGAQVEQLLAEGSEHFTLDIGRKSPLSLRHIPALKALWRDEAVDVVDARSRLPAWLAFAGWRRLPPSRRPRLVTTVHGAYSVNSYSAVMTRGEWVVAVSDSIRKYVLTNYPRCDPDRLITIHRGADRSDFPTGYRPTESWVKQWYLRFPELQGKQVLTLPGRLTRLKGHLEVLPVVERLKASGANVAGLFIGDAGNRGGYARELETSVRNRRLPVVFETHRGDIRDVYAMSDVVISASNKPESFGRTVLEALYLGRPVVGYDHGGVGEILRAMYPSGAVPVGDIDAMTTAVAKALDASQPIMVEDRFPLREMLDKTLALYENLAASPIPQSA